MTRYVTERTLGRGGMATVELARDEQLGRKVAIKRLFGSLSGDEDFRERFLREGRMAARLSHPNIVGVHDVGEEDGVPYIVMEHVEGETLADLIARKAPLDPDRAVDLVLQICAGLEHAHAAGLVHRDIKPQNLLVRSDDTVKIADFGIARPLDGTQMTQAGTVLGTAAYLAPEQALGERVTGAADIYSLGCVLYECITGATPFADKEGMRILWAHLQEDPPDPCTRRADAPSSLGWEITQALRKEPSHRPPTATAYARMVQAGVGSTGGGT